MGKYLIKVESMDMDEKLDERFQNGLECDGFVILADKEDSSEVALHRMSVDSISDIIVNNPHLMSAGILAKAKKEVVECSRAGKMKDVMSRLLDLE